jgi:putative ABC transport system permease protein
LNSSFMMMVLLANLIAWPVAYIFIDKWLSHFAYRVELSLWPFAFAMFISMGITLITVSFRSLRAAAANPVDALKDQ